MATYHVSTAGSDANSAAQAQNPLTPWLTIQKALDNVAAGDTVLIAAGTYTENPIVKTAGTLAAAGAGGTIKIYGCDVDFGDWTTAWSYPVQVTGGWTTTLAAATYSYYTFKNIRQYGNGGGIGWHLVTHCNTFWNCAAENNTGRGFYCNAYNLYVQCLSKGNGTYGYDWSSANNSYIYCRSFNNNVGFYNWNPVWIGCIAHNNATNGFQVYNGSILAEVDHCVADGNGTGFVMQAYRSTFMNNIITNNTTGVAGFTPNTGMVSQHHALFNCYHGNTTARSNSFPTGYGDVAVDPLYTDRTNDDFTLKPNSPLLGAGVHNSHIGFLYPPYRRPLTVGLGLINGGRL